MLSTKDTHQVLQPGAHQPDEEWFRTINSEDVLFNSFPAFPTGARLAVLVGDPTKPGPFLIRVKLSAGVKMMPHKHSEDRIYTVNSGCSTSDWVKRSTRRS